MPGSRQRRRGRKGIPRRIERRCDSAGVFENRAFLGSCRGSPVWLALRWFRRVVETLGWVEQSESQVPW